MQQKRSSSLPDMAVSICCSNAAISLSLLDLKSAEEVYFEYIYNGIMVQMELPEGKRRRTRKDKTRTTGKTFIIFYTKLPRTGRRLGILRYSSIRQHSEEVSHIVQSSD